MQYDIHTKEQIIINAGTFETFRKNLKITREKERKKEIGFTSSSDELNRKVLEKEKVDIFMPVLSGRKDFQKQRNSGFNQVMAKAAKNNKVAIGFNLDELLQEKGKEKADILARMIQNIQLCKKHKLKVRFISQKPQDSYNLKSLGLVLGIPTSEIKSF